MPIDAISVRGITHRFGERLALDDLSFDVPAGTVFGFLGPNGAGKTTTINVILGLLQPQHGVVDIFGERTSSSPTGRREHIGALLEYDGLYEQLSAQDNLEFYARIWGFSREERSNRIRTLLTQMALWERRQEKVSRWSRGMKRRLALARALLHRPRLVILDEPTAGLDVVNSARVHADLEALVSEEDVTVFLTTHNMPEAEKLCDTIAVVREGKLLSMGEPSSLRSRARAPVIEIFGQNFPDDTERILRELVGVSSVDVRPNVIRVSTTGSADTSTIVATLVAAGTRVEGVERSTATLEEAFLDLVNEDREEMRASS